MVEGQEYEQTHYEEHYDEGQQGEYQEYQVRFSVPSWNLHFYRKNKCHSSITKKGIRPMVTVNNIKFKRIIINKTINRYLANSFLQNVHWKFRFTMNRRTNKLMKNTIKNNREMLIMSRLVSVLVIAEIYLFLGNKDRANRWVPELASLLYST